MTPYQKQEIVNLFRKSLRRYTKDRSNGYTVEFERGYRRAVADILNLIGDEHFNFYTVRDAAAQNTSEESEYSLDPLSPNYKGQKF